MAERTLWSDHHWLHLIDRCLVPRGQEVKSVQERVTGGMLTIYDESGPGSGSG